MRVNGVCNSDFGLGSACTQQDLESGKGWGPGTESLVLRERSTYRMSRNCTTVLFKSYNADGDNNTGTVKRSTKLF